MTDKPDDRSRGYIVVAQPLEESTKYQDCMVIQYGDPYPPTVPGSYIQVYGPASLRECERWVAANCSSRARQS